MCKIFISLRMLKFAVMYNTICKKTKIQNMVVKYNTKRANGANKPWPANKK